MNILTSSTIGAQIFLILGIIGSIAGGVYYGVDINTFLLILLGYFVYGCLGIVVTFHRLLTHRSYKTNIFIERLFSIFGCLGGTGSSLAWAAIHINHHLKSDKPTDPHSPSYKGLKIFMLDYAHEVDKNTKWRLRYLIKDRFHQFLHRYYFGIIISYSLLLLLIGGPYLMLFLHWAPAAINALMSNIVNYIGHKPNWIGSYRTYNLNDKSSNNWIFAIPTWGETWHNNHHRHPKNFSCGEKWYEIDISAFIIRVIKHP
jgi:stearoyl-CoA desaturase (delta-9 desaturase)